MRNFGKIMLVFLVIQMFMLTGCDDLAGEAYSALMMPGKTVQKYEPPAQVQREAAVQPAATKTMQPVQQLPATKQPLTTVKPLGTDKQVLPPASAPSTVPDIPGSECTWYIDCPTVSYMTSTGYRLSNELCMNGYCVAPGDSEFPTSTCDIIKTMLFDDMKASVNGKKSGAPDYTKYYSTPRHDDYERYCGGMPPMLDEGDHCYAAVGGVESPIVCGVGLDCVDYFCTKVSEVAEAPPVQFDYIDCRCAAPDLALCVNSRGEEVSRDVCPQGCSNGQCIGFDEAEDGVGQAELPYIKIVQSVKVGDSAWSSAENPVQYNLDITGIVGPVTIEYEGSGIDRNSQTYIDKLILVEDQWYTLVENGAHAVDVTSMIDLGRNTLKFENVNNAGGSNVDDIKLENVIIRGVSGRVTVDEEGTIEAGGPAEVCGCWDNTVTCYVGSEMTSQKDCSIVGQYGSTCQDGECVANAGRPDQNSFDRPEGEAKIDLLHGNRVELGDSNKCKDTVFKREVNIEEKIQSPVAIYIKASGIHSDYPQPVVKWKGQEVGVIPRAGEAVILLSNDQVGKGSHMLRIDAQTKVGGSNYDDITIEEVEVRNVRGSRVVKTEGKECDYHSECKEPYKCGLPPQGGTKACKMPSCDCSVAKECASDTIIQECIGGFWRYEYAPDDNHACYEDPWTDGPIWRELRPNQICSPGEAECIDSNTRKICDSLGENWRTETDPQGRDCVNGDWVSYDYADAVEAGATQPAVVDFCDAADRADFCRDKTCLFGCPNVPFKLGDGKYAFDRVYYAEFKAYRMNAPYTVVVRASGVDLDFNDDIKIGSTPSQRFNYPATEKVDTGLKDGNDPIIEYRFEFDEGSIVQGVNKLWINTGVKSVGDNNLDDFTIHNIWIENVVGNRIWKGLTDPCTHHSECEFNQKYNQDQLYCMMYTPYAGLCKATKLGSNCVNNFMCASEEGAYCDLDGAEQTCIKG